MLKTLFEQIWLFVWAHSNLKRVNQYILNLAQKSLGINNYKSDALSGEEFWCKKAVQLYQPVVVFDIGAHKGDYAKMIRKAGYSNHLFLFEPHPATFSILDRELSTDPHTHLYNIGFSDEGGTHLLFDYSGDNQGSGSEHASLFSEVITDFHGSANASSTKVELDTLDHFAEVNQIDRISLLKIDTEGNEYKILKGASKLLKEGRIDLIQFEFGEMNVASRVFFKDFYNLLHEQYKLYRLLPNALLPLEPYNARHHEIFIYQNIVAVHRALVADQ